MRCEDCKVLDIQDMCVDAPCPYPEDSPKPEEVMTYDKLVDSIKTAQDKMRKQGAEPGRLKISRKTYQILHNHGWKPKFMGMRVEISSLSDDTPYVIESDDDICFFCGGHLSEWHVSNGRRYRHCYSCHFDFFDKDGA